MKAAPVSSAQREGLRLVERKAFNFYPRPLAKMGCALPCPAASGIKYAVKDHGKPFLRQPMLSTLSEMALWKAGHTHVARFPRWDEIGRTKRKKPIGCR